MGMGLVDGFREVVRVLLGLPADPGEPPDLMRLGLYRATVQACASDGSTCDVQTEDTRISGEKNVKVRVGVPGLSAVVQPGAVVLLGWERGDPGRPYCVPSWEDGATVTQLIIAATMIYLGAQGGADALVKKSEFNAHTHSVPATGITAPFGGGACSGTATAAAPTAITGTTKIKAV
jgi:hypothetical protein